MAKIWLTYAWKDNDEGNFDYLVQQLGKIGCEADYDKISLVPGMRLWAQISDRIIRGSYDGWGYLLTPMSISSDGCKEELAYALERALNEKDDFPLIGLVHQISFHDIPDPLRVRLCIDLRNPDWAEQVLAALERRSPSRKRSDLTMYIWHVHRQYQGIASQTAIEVRPRFGDLRNWKLIVPEPAPIIVRWGHGSANGGALAGIALGVVEGFLNLPDGTQARFYGQDDLLSPGTSAYMVFDGPIPAFIGFGVSNGSLEPPKDIEYRKLG